MANAPELVILDSIAPKLDLQALARRLRVAEDGPDYADLAALVRDAGDLARPRALYRIAYVDEHGEDYVVVNGVRMQSRVLAVNLQKAHRVFAHVATCGVELDAWAHGLTDVLWQFWGEEIKVAALHSATAALTEDLEVRLEPGKTANMNPGSLPDWPLSEQRRLFEVLGDVESAIGVRLTPSMLMVPNKSTSGIRFPTEVDFVNCSLCPREACPGRRAPYDATLYAERFARA